MERQELLTLRSDCILGYCRDKFWTPARAIMPVFAIDLQGLLVTGLIYAPLGIGLKPKFKPKLKLKLELGLKQRTMTRKSRSS